MKNICFLFVSVVVICSCGDKPNHVMYPDTSAIVGLGMPVTLQSDTTTVLVNDFFVDESLLDSVKTNPNLSSAISSDKKKIVLIATGNVPALSILSCYSKGFKYDVLLKRSPKVDVSLVYDPKGKDVKKVELNSEINSWTSSQNPFTNKDGKWELNLKLNPGRYQYQIVVDGKSMLDPSNPDSADNNVGGFNSILKAGSDDRSKLPQLFTSRFNDDSIVLGTVNDPDSVFVLWENYRLSCLVRGQNIFINLPEAAKKMNRSHIRAWSYNKDGASNDILIPLQNGKVITDAKELTRFDKHKTIMYFTMIDRFKDGDTTINHPLKDPRVSFKADYQGGDLAGIAQKIKDGYFTKLGFNCIWISPITQNPLVAYQEYPQPRRWFSGYHGYWPISFTKVDSRFGNDAALKNLVEEAHKNNINVILDFVANHVHEENPLYKNHPEYFTSVDLPDGRKNIRIWDEFRLTTWFDTFMPDIDYSKPEVVDLMTDSAVYWIKKFNLDGFRHDATKHVPEVFWESLTKKLKQQVIIPEKRDLLQIGETFGSRELIGSYVSSGMQDAQFDFNLYFDARTVLAQDNSSFDILKNSIYSSFNYYGWHSLMGNVTGNADIIRFITLASGAMSFSENDKEPGWIKDIEVKDPIGYSRLKMLEALIMTIPGIPVVYAGDDIGDPGANDPDNRRMMRFNNLKPEEEGVKSNLEKLSAIRKNSMPLLFGDYELLQSSDSTLVFARYYFDKIDVVAFNKSRNPVTVNIEIPDRFSSSKLTAQLGSEMEQDGKKLKINLKPASAEILQ